MHISCIVQHNTVRYYGGITELVKILKGTILVFPLLPATDLDKL